MTHPPDDAPLPADAADDDGANTASQPVTRPARPKRPLFTRRPRARAAPETDAVPPVPPETDQPTEVVELPPRPPLNPGRLRRERRGLVARRQEAVYHLGGLAFELFRRDMLTESVMRLRAEEVADIDRSVIAIDEELLSLDETRRARREERAAVRREARVRQKPPSGYCLSCGAPYRDPINFCANCGSPVVRAEPEENGEQPTTVVETGSTSGATEIIETPPPEEAPRP